MKPQLQLLLLRVSSFMLSLAVASGAFYAVQIAGYDWPLGIGVAAIAFTIVSSYIAYRYISQALLQEGTKPPSYFAYLLVPRGAGRLNDEASKFGHLLVAGLAAPMGSFLLFCGVALTIKIDWSSLPHAMVLLIFSLVPTGIGVTFLCVAWRCFPIGERSQHVA